MSVELIHKFSMEMYEVRVNKPYNDIGLSKEDHWTLRNVVEPDNLLYLKFTKDQFLTDEKSFIEHYGNLLADVQIHRHTLVLEKYNGKISLKYFYFQKYRRPGFKFFKRRKNMSYLTYNTNTGCLYKGNSSALENSSKKVGSIRKNYFHENPVKKFMNGIPDLEILVNKSEYVIKHPVNTKGIFYKDFFVKEFLSQIPNFRFSHLHNYDTDLYRLYLEQKNVKVSNNWFAFKNVTPIPRKHIWKRNGYKLIDTIMDAHKFKGDKIKNILHKINNFSPDIIKYFNVVFGEEYMRQQSVEDCVKVYDGYYGDFYWDLNATPESYGLSLKEKNNIFKLLVNCADDSNPGRIIGLVKDHLKFYQKIRKYEKIKWKSSNYDDFNSEHITWSNKYSFYTSGCYSRVYDQNLIDHIQKPFDDQFGQEYKPIVLTSTAEYNEESSYQSNCVKTYIKRASSFIISLRRDEGKDRATIEYRINKVRDKVFFSRVQTLGRFNHTLSHDWHEVLSVLDKRIENYLSTNEFVLPKLSNKLPGIEDITNSKFCDKFNYLIWEENVDETRDLILPIEIPL